MSASGAGLTFGCSGHKILQFALPARQRNVWHVSGANQKGCDSTMIGVRKSLAFFVLDDDNTIRPLQSHGCSRRTGVSKVSSSSSSSHNSRREPLDSPLVLALLLLIIMVSFLF